MTVEVSPDQVPWALGHALRGYRFVCFTPFVKVPAIAGNASLAVMIFEREITDGEKYEISFLCDACFRGGEELTLGLIGDRPCENCGKNVLQTEKYHFVKKLKKLKGHADEKF
jgi:hypothetical protein